MSGDSHNSITIKGPKSDISEIKDYFQRPNPFQSIYPCPEELVGNDIDLKKKIVNKEKYGVETEDDWKCEHWGIGEIDYKEIAWIKITNKRLIFRISTVSSPDGILRHLSEMYDRCTFHNWNTRGCERYDTIWEYTFGKGDYIFHSMKKRKNKIVASIYEITDRKEGPESMTTYLPPGWSKDDGLD